ncbi:DUF6338 family protein [Halococcus dombrowskii]|uniref:DUF6338 family protein n=1 Tax=Halococcus dombrowskii TaxID=179637 RepID=A0AAV3SKD6_HALDO|nr:DUF6338 family protein [Halococcus dombrowskii]UOO95961.1 DUF6338 family protein [Halococcus dombrowskii]
MFYGESYLEMVAVNILTANLIYPVLLILPGLIGLKIYLRTAGAVNDFSRLDAIIFSLGISVASVLAMYAVYGIILMHPPTFNDVQFNSLPLLMGLYLIHFVVSCLIGWLLGRCYDSEGNGPREELWDFIFEELFTDSQIRVVKPNGSQIEGNIQITGDSPQSRDLILSSATEIKQDGTESRDLGEFTYVHERGVSHIEIVEEIDKETLRDFGYLDGELKSPKDEESEEEIERELEHERERINPELDTDAKSEDED